MTTFKDAYINMNGDTIYIVKLDINQVEYEYYWNFGNKGLYPSQVIYHSPLNFKRPCPYCGLNLIISPRCPQSQQIHQGHLRDVKMNSIYENVEKQPIDFYGENIFRQSGL